MLADMPKVGTAMLFARTDERGRISLVRTGHVTRFERYVEDPFLAVDDRPSVVATSAPPLTASMVPTQRKVMLPPPDPYAEGERLDDRTKPLQALRPSDFRKLRPVPTAGPTSEPPTLRTPNTPGHRAGAATHAERRCAEAGRGDSGKTSPSTSRLTSAQILRVWSP